MAGSADRSGERLAMLLHAGAALATVQRTLDGSLAPLAEVLVPAFADAVRVEVVGDDGRLRCVLEEGDATGDRLAVPLRVRGLAVGSLVVHRRHQRERFDEVDLATAEIVAGRLAMTVERVTAYRELAATAERERLQAERLRLLAEASLRIQEADSEHAVLASTRAACRQVLGHAGGDVVVDGGVVRVRPGLVDGDPGLEAARHLLGRIATASLHRVRLASELALSQEEVVRAQRMDAVGRVAGGLAHDFNNLLTAVIGFTELALRSLPDDAPAAADLQEVLLAGRRAAELSTQLLTVSRGRVVERTTLEVGPWLRGFERMLQRAVGAAVELTVTVDEGPLVVEGDPGQLEQVVLNLVLNARDAMPEGGRLDLTVRGAGERVHLVVADTGVGMDADTLARCFEPLFTTKPAGSGTGLGLAVVYGIVGQHGGEVHVTSRQGEGTTIVVELPRSTAAVRAADGAGVTDGADRSGDDSRLPARILLVDDEEGVRLLAQQLLERDGNTVVAAADPAEALAAAADEGPFDLLVTDVVMPGMPGPRLAEELSPDGELPVVFMSGFAKGGFERMAPNARFVTKPFTAAELLAAVRAVLGAEDQGSKR